MPTSANRWRGLLKRWYAYAGREPVVLTALLLVILGTWLFFAIAEEVTEGSTRQIDEWVVRAMRRPENSAQPLGPPWVQEMMRDMTALGGVGWMILATMATAGFLWLSDKHRMAFFLLAAVASGWTVAVGLKFLFGRPRPDLVLHLSHVSSSSFPSGHSMLSAVVYLTLGSLVATVVPHRRLKLYVLGVALVLSGLVGLSRVYLGVHYPTDVLAGWTAGVVWALVCWILARWLQRRGQVEDEATPVHAEAVPAEVAATGATAGDGSTRN